MTGGVAASQNDRLIITGVSIVPGDKATVKGSTKAGTKGSGSEVQYWSSTAKTAPDWQPAAKIPLVCGEMNQATLAPGPCLLQYGHCIAYAKDINI